MKESEVQDVLARWARDRPLVGRLFVFGSRAREDHHPDSDIDIAIELDMSAAQGTDDSGSLATWIFEAESWAEELQALLPFEVDLEQYRGLDTPTIHKGLARSSVLVYVKGR